MKVTEEDMRILCLTENINRKEESTRKTEFWGWKYNNLKKSTNSLNSTFDELVEEEKSVKLR